MLTTKIGKNFLVIQISILIKEIPDVTLYSYLSLDNRDIS